jgi:zona occludens toxin (predicted ATPase)
MIILNLGDPTYTGLSIRSGKEVVTEVKGTVLPQINDTPESRGKISIVNKQMTNRKAKTKKTNLSSLQQDCSGG